MNAIRERTSAIGARLTPARVLVGVASVTLVVLGLSSGCATGVGKAPGRARADQALRFGQAQGFARYAVREALRIPWGEGRGRIALWRTTDRGQARAAVAAYGVAADGSVWVFDHVARFGGPRLQRFDERGRALVEADAGVAPPLMAVTRGGDVLYVELASATGQGLERVSRLDGKGRRIATYGVPAGLSLTGVAVSPDGGVFGRTAAWEPDPTGKYTVLRPKLTYLGDSAPAKPDLMTSLAGHDFAWTGELVETEWRDVTIASKAQIPTARSIRYLADRATVTHEYTLPTGFDWVGTDAAGNTYLAEVAPRGAQETGERWVLGQVRYSTVQVAVFAPDGAQRALVNLPWDQLSQSVMRPIQVDPSGRIFVAGGDARGFIVYGADPGGAK